MADPATLISGGQLALSVGIAIAAGCAAIYGGMAQLGNKLTKKTDETRKEFGDKLDELNKTFQEFSEGLVRVEERKVSWESLREHCRDQQEHCLCAARLSVIEKEVSRK